METKANNEDSNTDTPKTRQGLIDALQLFDGTAESVAAVKKLLFPGEIGRAILYLEKRIATCQTENCNHGKCPCDLRRALIEALGE